MDFAKKQLEKYGWKEGKGLGINESGISVALKPKLKFNTSGLGHNASEQFTFNWWENVYQQAANNVKVKSEEGTVAMEIVDEDAVTISTKEYAFKKLLHKNKNSNSAYGSFITTGALIEKSDDEDDSKNKSKYIQMTDEELFAACGGRTAHKGARHGLKLSGKLERLAKQEEQLLNNCSNEHNISFLHTNHDLNTKLDKKLLSKQIKMYKKELMNISTLDNEEHKNRRVKKIRKKIKKYEKLIYSIDDSVNAVYVKKSNSKKNKDAKHTKINMENKYFNSEDNDCKVMELKKKEKRKRGSRLEAEEKQKIFSELKNSKEFNDSAHSEEIFLLAKNNEQNLNSKLCKHKKNKLSKKKT